jgi:predicted dinucleotide-binding enzyme
MRIGVLGTGGVGQTLAGKLAELGHDVCMGSREAGNEKAVQWAAEAGEHASEGSFADAAGHGELVLNATPGAVALEALRAAGGERLAGKVLIDVSNPLDFSNGFPPTLTVCNDDSVGEQIQREFPDARVVKMFNTIPAELMVNPRAIEPSHTLPLCGEDDAAKGEAVALAESLGWPREDLLDLGGIAGARGMEMFLGLWVRLIGATGNRLVTVKVLSA